MDASETNGVQRTDPAGIFETVQRQRGALSANDILFILREVCSKFHGAFERFQSSPLDPSQRRAVPSTERLQHPARRAVFAQIYSVQSTLPGMLGRLRLLNTQCPAIKEIQSTNNGKTDKINGK